MLSSTEEIMWFNVVMTDCYADKQNVGEACKRCKYIVLAQGRTPEFIILKRRAVETEEIMWFNVVMTDCYADKQNVGEARKRCKCTALAQGRTPEFIIFKRRAVEKRVLKLGEYMEV